MTLFRKYRLAVMAWVLPLVLLVSGLAQSAAMFCRMQGALLSSGCCCPTSADSGDDAQPLHDSLEQQACCEVAAQAPGAPVAVVVALSAFELDAPLVPTKLGALVSAMVPQPSSRTRLAPPLQPPRPSLVVLKHAFLI